ncbi:hypothetical protein OIU79_015847, partial [Salix purpurea]
MLLAPQSNTSPMAPEVSLFSLTPSVSFSSCLQLDRRFFSPSFKTLASASSTSNLASRVVVTRERGKNGKLIKALVLSLFLYLNLLLFLLAFLSQFDYVVVFYL